MTDATSADVAAERKARGAYFTPSEVCDFAARWALRTAGDLVLEPSCGEAAFLVAAAQQLTELGNPQPHVTAVEIDAPTARTAAGILGRLGARASIEVGDFLVQRPAPVFDAVIGNPPFIRYQTFRGDSRAAGVRAALAEGVRLTGLSSSWAPFVVHASAFLRPGGRLALVLPGELLSANYASAVRSYLQSHFSELRIIAFDGQLFPGAQTETLLLLADGKGGSTDDVDFRRVASVTELFSLSQAVSRLSPRVGDKWTGSLADTAAIDRLDYLSRAGLFTGADSWGRLSLGAVTGANKFFAITAARVAELGLEPSDVLPLSPPGSAHLRALTIGQADADQLARDGQRVRLFRPEDPSPAARRYIDEGLAAGIDQAYKCRVRTPWWRVPLPPTADLFLTYMNAQTPQFAHNPAGLRHVNSVHGLVLGAAGKSLADVLPVAALNSATMLSAELTGRAYGGGILKLEPREAARLAVPSLPLAAKAAAALREAHPKVRELLLAGRLPDAVTMVDEVVLIEGCGWTTEDVLAVRESRDTLAHRRQARGRTTRAGAQRG